MNIFCRACSGLILEDAEVMNPVTFKERHGSSCPHCGVAYSDQFRVKDADKIVVRIRH